MDFYMQANAAESAPKLSTLTEKGHFTAGSPELAIPPSTPGAAWFESVTAEIVNAIEKLGGTPSRDEIDQLATTLSAKFATKADLESPAFTGNVTVPAPINDDNPITKAYLVSLLNQMSIVPTGSVLTFAGSSIPSGFLLCNGAAISRTTYAKLFAAIGTMYGAGDGATTFNLPDMRDRFAEGAGTYSVGADVKARLPDIVGSAQFLGVESCTGTEAMKNNHSLKQTSWPYGHVDNSRVNNLGVIEFEASNHNSIYAKHSTVQPNSLVFNYLIKY